MLAGLLNLAKDIHYLCDEFLTHPKTHYEQNHRYRRRKCWRKLRRVHCDERLRCRSCIVRHQRKFRRRQSGIPRKPGMTREELIGINAGIVKGVVENCLAHSPNAIFVIVSNPMDTMTYLALKASGLPKNRIIGMGGILDSSRFRHYLSQALNCPASDVDGMVIGGHGDTTMIPLTRLAGYRGVAVSNFANTDVLSKVKADTMVGGATLTGMLGTSAWYAPGASVAVLVQSIVCDQKKMFPCSIYLEGEYNQSDICMGVPVIIGASGWESIVSLDLNEEEKAEFAKSADAVRSMNNAL